jgi:hypothetical protein
MDDPNAPKSKKNTPWLCREENIVILLVLALQLLLIYFDLISFWWIKLMDLLLILYLFDKWKTISKKSS